MPDKNNFTRYGQPPYKVFLVHGGPGAIGDMLPVAEKLSDYMGVVETFHYGLTIDEQLTELYKAIVQNTEEKVLLIGHSWGAWLSYLFAAKFSKLVKKLILIGSAPFTVGSSEDIMERRFQNLSNIDKRMYISIISRLNIRGQSPSTKILEQFRLLLLKADSFELTDDFAKYTCKLDYNVYKNVWPLAEELRKNGVLLEEGKKIICPVLAIHGNHDPHKFEGVSVPLKNTLNYFRFELLIRCGHYPWFEKFACIPFYEILLNET